MSKNETKLRIFLASPGDVADERDALRETVEEVNKLLDDRGVRFAVYGWEDAMPGFGSDAQDVINKQLNPADCDVFVCIIWLSVGNSTQRAESGTIEEYEIAKAKHDKDPDTIQVMVYFKREDPKMDDIDIEQLAKVQAFRSRVREEGGLYADFKSTDEFSARLRAGLTKIGMEWHERSPRGVLEDEHEPDEGMFDLEDIVSEEVDEIEAVCERHSALVSDLVDNMREQARIIEDTAKHDKEGNDGRRNGRVRLTARRAAKEIARHMDSYARKGEEEISLYGEHLNRFLDASTKLVPIYLEMAKTTHDRAELNIVRDSASGLLGNMEELVQTIADTQTSIISIPRVSTSLNKSKKRVINVLRQFSDVALGGIGPLEQILSMLQND